MTAYLSNIPNGQGSVYSYTSSGYQEPIHGQLSYMQYCTYPIIDYDLLAEKIVEKLKGKESKSIEEVRKELNKLLDEVAKKEKDKKG